jgi:hypothetical protein
LIFSGFLYAEVVPHIFHKMAKIHHKRNHSCNHVMSRYPWNSYVNEGLSYKANDILYNGKVGVAGCLLSLSKKNGIY